MRGRPSGFEETILFPLRWLLTVPPVEQRHDFRGTLRYLIYGHYQRTDDDSYLYYKVYVVNLALNVFFSLAFWLAYLWRQDIDLGFYEIRYSDTFIDTFMYDYPTRILSALLAVTVVYSLVLFTLKSPHFLRASQAPQYLEHEVLKKNGPRAYAGVFLFSVVGMVLLFFFPDYFRSYSLYDSLGFKEQIPTTLLFMNVAYLFFYQLCVSNGVVFGLINFIDSVYRRSKRSKE